MPTDLSPALYIVKTGDTLPPLQKRHGDFEGWVERGLAGRGLPVRTIDPRRTLEWPARPSIAGVVVSGSPAMVTDRAAWSERTAAWLARLVREDVPVLGICYGHQLLAHALGGAVGPHQRGVEIGTVQVECTQMAQDDPLFGALPTQFKAQVVHEQSVLRLPPGATVLARNAHEPHHAFRIGRCAWSMQFHPEFSRAVMQGYLKLHGEKSPAEIESAMAKETPDAAALCAMGAGVKGNCGEIRSQVGVSRSPYPHIKILASSPS